MYILTGSLGIPSIRKEKSPTKKHFKKDEENEKERKKEEKIRILFHLLQQNFVISQAPEIELLRNRRFDPAHMTHFFKFSRDRFARNCFNITHHFYFYF